MIGGELWTVVTLDQGAPFARPVAGAPVGTWREAVDAVGLLTVPDTVTVRWVQAAGGSAYGEYVRRGSRRVPVMWGARPRYTFPQVAACPA